MIAETDLKEIKPKLSTAAPSSAHVQSGIPVPKPIRVKNFSPDEWEDFIEEWAASLESVYVKVRRFGGSGDCGVDVAGFCTDKGFEDKWDNYQCKRYAHPLRPSDIWVELGKIIYYSSIGEYTIPRKHYFVASLGVGTTLEKLLNKPNELREKFKVNWDVGVWGRSVLCWANKKKSEVIMSNIFHEIKRGFLILGFTGPLSSGCTTAAKFFENDINEFINKRCAKALSKIEGSIKRKYIELNELKKRLEKGKDKKNTIFPEMNRTTYQLKEKLKVREILSVLDEYKDNNFKYISMTDMLLKITIEHLVEANDNILPDKFKKIKMLIDFDSYKMKKANEINDQLFKREISDITKVDNELYEQYLNYISQFRDRLKKHFKVDDLGDLLQDLGDNARRCGNPLDYSTKFKKKLPYTLFILSEQANNIIKFYRNNKRKDFNLPVYKEFVIEAFRNPYEVEYFRNRYYEFYLFSILAPLTIRKERPNYNSYRDNRDQGRRLKPDEFFKQNVSECVHLSDIALNNNYSKLYILQRKLSKFFAIICRPGCITPTDDELFMQQAYCMSVGSNCISRQVGAIIVGPRNFIVGAGWNDVGTGQIPCGLRRYYDIDGISTPFPIAIDNEIQDFAAFLEKRANNYSNHSYCYKDEYSRFKTKNKIKKLKNSDTLFLKWKNEYEVSENAIDGLDEIVVSNFSPKRLEHCRALHAEENAIIQNSILGGVGIESATIYTTTFPCELCAKKIYQSRIKRVIYTEPYPESISEDVFFKDGSHFIELVQFEGVKSHSYYRLYKSTIDKKEFQIQEKF